MKISFSEEVDTMKRQILQSSQGIVSVEFLWMFMIFIALTFGIVEFGSILHERNIITHLAREGASIYSRDFEDANTIVNMIKDSSQSLDFPSRPDQHALFVARATAGDPPTCAATGGSGTLSESGVVDPASLPTCGLTPELLAYLQADANGVSQMQQFSVVRIYYKHIPLTPIAGLLSLPFFGGGPGLDPDPVMGTTAIF